MLRPKFGKIIKATVTLKRTKHYRIPTSQEIEQEMKGNTYYLDSYNKNKKFNFHEWEPETKIIEGIYIGYRTLSDGFVIWEGEEIGNVFHVLEYHEAWLIVEGPRRKPVYVKPDINILIGE